MSARSVCIALLKITATALVVARVLTSVASAQPAAPAEPPKDWEGTAGAGLSFTNGNSDTVAYNAAFDITRKPKSRNVMKWNGLHLRGEKDDELIVNRTTLGFRDEYSINTRAFVFGQLAYLRDTFKLIDYLVAPTGGVGFKVVDTEATKFAVDTGVGSVWEKNPGAEVRTTGAVTAGERLTHALNANASVKHAVAALWKANDWADGLYTFSIGLATKITERAQLAVDLLDTFKNRPATAATEKNDIALITAITAKF